MAQYEQRPVPGFSGYLADTCGNIIGPHGHVLSPVRIGAGRKAITVVVGYRKRQKLYVQFLVCSAFHGPRPPGKVVAHGDGNFDNNIPTNLRWATQQENIDDRERHGTTARGERAGLAKLTQKQADAIRVAYTPGSAKTLAEQYGVGLLTIYRVARNKTYRGGQV